MTKRRIKTPGSEAIHEARKAVREEFPDAPEWAIKRLALLMCARDGYEASLALGERLDLDALLKVDAVIEEIRAKLTKEKPHSISVTIVKGVHGIYKCRHCGEQNELKPGEYEPAKPRPFHGRRRCSCGRLNEFSSEPFPDGNPGTVTPQSDGAPSVSAAPAVQSSPNVVPISPTLREWNRQHGYSVAPDGQLGRNNPVRRRDPNPLGNVLAEPNPMHKAEKGHPSPECFK